MPKDDKEIRTGTVDLKDAPPVLVRLSPVERRRLVRAAQIESERRKVPVGMGTLLREFGMPGIEGILAEQQAAAAS